MGEMTMPCPRAGKWIGGCRFEARYNEGAPDLSSFESLKGPNVQAFVESLKPLTYIHDICIRCGRIVEPTITNEQASRGQTEEGA